MTAVAASPGARVHTEAPPATPCTSARDRRPPYRLDSRRARMLDRGHCLRLRLCAKGSRSGHDTGAPISGI